MSDASRSMISTDGTIHDPAQGLDLPLPVPVHVDYSHCCCVKPTNGLQLVVQVLGQLLDGQVLHAPAKAQKSAGDASMSVCGFIRIQCLRRVHDHTSWHTIGHLQTVNQLRSFKLSSIPNNQHTSVCRSPCQHTCQHASQHERTFASTACSLKDEEWCSW